MRIFAKVIGASMAAVALVFAVVAGVLHWSEDGTSSPAPMAADARAADDSTPMTRYKTPEPAPRPRPPALRQSSDPAARPTTSASSTAVDVAQKKATKTAAAPVDGNGKKAEKSMSSDEFLAREVYYIEKIQKDAEDVLARAAEERARTAALEAELDELLYQ